jgi:hypothetical protein
LFVEVDIGSDSGGDVAAQLVDAAGQFRANLAHLFFDVTRRLSPLT